MAMAFKDVYMNTNGFGTMYVCEIGWDLDLGDYYSYYLEGEKQTLSIINAQPIWDLLPSWNGYGMTMMQEGVNWQTLHGETYQEYIADFKAHTFFLWGDVDSGGCFFFKNEMGTQMYYGIMYGLASYTSGSDTLYRYIIGRGTDPNGLDIAHSKEIAIAFRKSNLDDDRFPNFTLYSGLGSGVSGIKVGDYQEDPLLPGVYHYEIRNTGSLMDATSNPAYTDFLIAEDVPLQVWRCDKEQPIIFAQIPEILSLEGAWTGDSSIDVEVNPNRNGGNSRANGGSGEYPDKSDDTTPPDSSDSSAPDAINSGFITLYNPTKSEIKDFNDYLFSDSITSEISNQLKKLIADPIDYLVFIAQCRFSPNVGLLNQEITFAGIGSGVTAKVIQKQWQTIDCGTIHLSEDTDSFQDYSPYSKCSIFLPYVGFRDLPIEEIKNSDITVKYQVDLLTGSAVAQVTVNRPNRSYLNKDANPSFTGQILEYECNVFEMLPISSTDFRNFYSGLMGIAGGAIGVASGNLGGLGAMGSSVMSMKTNVQRSGNASGSYGYFGGQDPYLLISRPFQAYPENFASYEGFPSNMTMNIKDCTGNPSNGWAGGYIETDDNTVWGNDIDYTYGQTTISAFDDEMDEIKQLFNTGVIVNV